ncbi:hypothetical protein BD311DRAFT_330179 [Dichomitus squalens]|uniref:Uncharacterized protein n=1 Tax=Dichomitus squalens TaxID=114155 RepID=A0A4Q9MMD5_9APHY|nr:hypothetical protein BD311DRAFT_330179 [Dichomitus squalens]
MFVAGPIRGCSLICRIQRELTPWKRDHAGAGDEEEGNTWDTVVSLEGNSGGGSRLWCCRYVDPICLIDQCMPIVVRTTAGFFARCIGDAGPGIGRTRSGEAASEIRQYTAVCPCMSTRAISWASSDTYVSARRLKFKLDSGAEERLGIGPLVLTSSDFQRGVV